MRLSPKCEEWLKFFGDLGPTIKGDQFKGWHRDEEGSNKFYLDAAECREIAAAFTEAAEFLDHNANAAPDLKPRQWKSYRSFPNQKCVKCGRETGVTHDGECMKCFPVDDRPKPEAPAPVTAKCCGKDHPIIEWTTKGPTPYGAECSVCGRRVAGETAQAVRDEMEKRDAERSERIDAQMAKAKQRKDDHE